jgi:hypothetical protein
MSSVLVEAAARDAESGSRYLPVYIFGVLSQDEGDSGLGLIPLFTDGTVKAGFDFVSCA